VLAEARERAQEALDRGALSRSLPARIATIAIVLTWLLVLAFAGLLIVRPFMR
jgi:TRAP-type C4-dicarboxylate transport system permease small subunit